MKLGLWRKFGIKARCQHDWHVSRVYGDRRLEIGIAAEAVCRHCGKWRRASLAEVIDETENQAEKAT